MHFKHYALGALVAAGLVSTHTAIAEPMAQTRESAENMAAPLAVDWSGFYLGATAGYVAGTSTYCSMNFVDSCDGNASNIPLPEPQPEGGVFGLTGGYAWQSGHLVYGFEADISQAYADGSAEDTAYFGCGSNDCQTDILAMATLRGRVGYAHDKWLPYATAGVGAMQVEVGLPNIDPASRSKDIIVSPVIGLGVEYMATENISLKFEVLHIFTNDDLVEVGNGLCSSACGATDIEANLLRFGVNYHF
ncbi:outer membrane protein [Celeribacter naphthalenivorans]|uniref:outer membrane protein n=1 Tax=Celeribacter naphthalenivorans TaxID=1614694 RepID=UPI001CFA2653|nr:outer membrane beta-barrel protein [Celeribacter naphthalenivorans]